MSKALLLEPRGFSLLTSLPQEPSLLLPSSASGPSLDQLVLRHGSNFSSAVSSWELEWGPRPAASLSSRLRMLPLQFGVLLS